LPQLAIAGVVYKKMPDELKKCLSLYDILEKTAQHYNPNSDINSFYRKITSSLTY